MPLFGFMPGKQYTLASVGAKRKINRVFSSRQEAMDYMYAICGKRGYRITRVWDDKHDKTYICDNDGVRFFICRA
jgi:hypothetical protein